MISFHHFKAFKKWEEKNEKIQTLVKFSSAGIEAKTTEAKAATTTNLSG
jgi:hypothetical protein